ncbi:MAG TPA: hypothetical protein VGA46_09695, partial [Methyloceanibacter sp.]
MRAALFVLCVAVIWNMAGNASAGPIEDGNAAFERGDWATAIRHWQAPAQHGHAEAQYYLANMY